MVNPEIVEETSSTIYEAISPTIDADSEKTESLQPSWLENQLIKYLLPIVKH